MSVPHLVQYQGSKRKLAEDILKYFPRKIEGNFIEPFSGTGAITIAVAHKNLANKYILNDLNKHLASLLDAVVNKPHYVVTKYKEIWEGQFSKEDHYYLVRDKFNDTQDPVMFYICCKICQGRCEI